MNIFYLDEDINKCASYYIDRHVVKIRVEIAQMLGVAFTKGAWYNHPMSQWVRDTEDNFNWTIELGIALCKEKDFRYGPKPQESLSKIAEFLYTKPDYTNKGLKFPLCMLDKHKVECPIQSYRNYYVDKMFDKRGNYMGIWTNRERPEWLISNTSYAAI